MTTHPAPGTTIPARSIADSIFIARGQAVLLGSDLARFYGVSTRRLNAQVRRNSARFPPDFVFVLHRRELSRLRGVRRRGAACVFTEHGAIMAATVLNTPNAVEASVFVIRAFVRMREALAAEHAAITRRLVEVDTRLTRKLESHDQVLVGVLAALGELRRAHHAGRPVIVTAPPGRC